LFRLSFETTATVIGRGAQVPIHAFTAGTFGKRSAETGAAPRYAVGRHRAAEAVRETSEMSSRMIAEAVDAVFTKDFLQR
jgi:hypothetical protein